MYFASSSKVLTHLEISISFREAKKNLQFDPVRPRRLNIVNESHQLPFFIN